MADGHKGVASNFKAQRCSVETDDVPKVPLAKWDAVNATSYMKGC